MHPRNRWVTESPGYSESPAACLGYCFDTFQSLESWVFEATFFSGLVIWWRCSTNSLRRFMKPFCAVLFFFLSDEERTQQQWVHLPGACRQRPYWELRLKVVPLRRQRRSIGSLSQVSLLPDVQVCPFVYMKVYEHVRVKRDLENGEAIIQLRCRSSITHSQYSNSALQEEITSARLTPNQGTFSKKTNQHLDKVYDLEAGAETHNHVSFFFFPCASCVNCECVRHCGIFREKNDPLSTSSELQAAATSCWPIR